MSTHYKTYHWVYVGILKAKEKEVVHKTKHWNEDTQHDQGGEETNETTTQHISGHMSM